MSSVVRAPEMASACSSRSRSAKRAANPRLPSRLSGGSARSVAPARTRRRSRASQTTVASLPSWRTRSGSSASSGRQRCRTLPAERPPEGPGASPGKTPTARRARRTWATSSARPGPGSWGDAIARRSSTADTPVARTVARRRALAGTSPPTTRAVPSGSTASWQEPSSSDPGAGTTSTETAPSGVSAQTRSPPDASSMLTSSCMLPPSMRPPRRRSAARRVILRHLGYPTRRNERRI